MISRSHIWLNSHTGKAHLDPNCHYCNNGASKKPLEVFPENHVQFCSLCEKRNEKWLKNNKTPYDVSGCERCGRQTDTHTHLCESCHQKTILKR